MRLHFKLRLVLVLAAILPAQASALVILNPESITSYTNFNTSSLPVNGFPNNARVGNFYRHALVFDLRGVSEQITGATLQIESGLGTHVSIGTSRTYTVWDVTSPITDIARRIQGGAAAAYYEDLGTGQVYGTTTVGVTPTNGANPLPSPAVTVDLQRGLTDLNAARGDRIAFGGTSPQTFYMFSGRIDPRLISLTLTTEPVSVPLPGTMPLILAALLSTCFLRLTGRLAIRRHAIASRGRSV